MSLIRDFTQFIISPKYNILDNNPKAKSKIWLSFRLWCLSILVAFSLAVLTDLILRFTGYKGSNLIDVSIQKNLLSTIVAAVIVAPILEELIFRGWLGKNRLVLAGSFFLVLCILGLFLLPKISLGGLYGIAFGVSYMVMIFVLSLVILFSKHFRSNITNFVTNHFRLFFYLSAILFGMAHISNNTMLREFWYLTPLFALPQLWGGLVLGYIRTRFGILYSILTHFINNLFAVSILILTQISSITTKVFGYSVFLLFVLIIFIVNIYNFREKSA